MQVAPRKCQLLFAFSAAFIVSLSSSGDEPPAKAELAKKYKELIQQLASPNQPATKRSSKARVSVTFPAKYDVKAQEQIDVVRKELQNNAQDALPYLVEALDDDRYCMTISWAEGDAYHNQSVGDVCEEIMRSQLEVYRSKMTFTKERWREYEYPISKEWYETRQALSLVELQIEAIDWAIEKRKTEPEKSIEGRRGEILRNEVAELERLRDGIAKTKKPTAPGRLLPMVRSNG